VIDCAKKKERALIATASREPRGLSKLLPGREAIRVLSHNSVALVCS